MNMLLSILESIRWQDIIDISLSSYILFRLYVLFRETHIFRVIAGIALLWVFQRVSVSLGLIVTSWAMQGIIAVAALIIIIVFRDEIRRVLQAKNLKAVLWGFSHKTVHTPVEIIIESVYDLARKYCGALIVFPAKEDIKDMVQGGVSWDGIISKEMMISIFWQDNPVHDGAAIIHGDRITEVGVILPLSQQNDFPSHYGTRHRAAAGLAESTDALTIVVSEERGNVVVARGSSIFNIKSKGELGQLLKDHVGIAPKDFRTKIKEKLEIGLAAFFSILFVTGIWLSFSRGLETLVTLEIPVEYMNRKAKMEIFDTSVNAVKLDLAGSGALIKSIRPEQVKVKIDLGNAVAGINTFTVTNENIFLPPGILLKKIEPSVVKVTLDVPTTKELPIQVDWVGKLPGHLLLYEVKLEPEKIRIIGGSHFLKNISTIYTEKVPLENLNETGVITVNPAFEPPFFKIAPTSKDKIKISYGIKRRLE